MLKAWINSIKSTKIVKKLNTGLIKLAKTLGLKPKLFYVLIGLFVVILVALGLGARREGFSSITAANNAQTKAIQDMLAAINAATWLTPADKTAFTTQASNFYSTKMKFLSQGDTTINKYDIGGPAGPNVPDGQVYVSNNFPDPVYDASKNALPLYVDNIATNKIDLTKYTLTSIVKNPVNKTDLDTLSSAINTAIGKLSGADQTALNTAFTALSKNADDMYEYTTNPTYDPYTFDNIIDQNSDNIYEDDYDTYDFEDEQTGYDFGSLVAGSMGPSGPAGPRGPRGLTGPRGPPGPAASRQVVSRQAASRQAASREAASRQAASREAASRQAASRQAESASPWGDAGAGSSGISKDNIPPGSQDMYLLKSQVVPPSNPPGAPASAQGASSSGAAPANPSPTQANSCSPAPVPPCPPCERCPEPAFDCKRVPKYNSAAINQYLPQPVLADFSQFGM
jgi:hypothetical protein